MSKFATIMVVRKKSGFGLLETLIASAIFIMVLGAVTSLARNIYKNNQLSMERALASNLAQEGLDLVKETSANSLLDLDPTTDWLHLKYNGNIMKELSGSDFDDNKSFELFYKKLQLDGDPAPSYRWVLERNNNKDGDKTKDEEHIFISNDGHIRSNRSEDNCPQCPQNPGEIHYIRKIKFREISNQEVEITNPDTEAEVIDATTAIEVEVEVSWNNGEHNVIASDILTSWQN